MESPENRDVLSSSVKWGQLGKRAWFEKRQRPLLLLYSALCKAMMVTAALGEITVLLFGIQIVKHTHLVTLTSPEVDLIKSFALFLREEAL